MLYVLGSIEEAVLLVGVGVSLVAELRLVWRLEARGVVWVLVMRFIIFVFALVFLVVFGSF